MASKLFPHVFTPGRIGTLELKNRVMKAPQSSGMSNKDGTVSERLIRYYRNQASGGAGMMPPEVPGHTAHVRAERHPLAEVMGSVRLAGRAPRADHRGDPGHSPRLRRRGLAREGRRLRPRRDPRRTRLSADELLLPHYEPPHRPLRRPCARRSAPTSPSPSA